MSDSISQLLCRHEHLDALADGEDSGNRLFGWQCENPFAGPLLSEVRYRETKADLRKYAYLEDNGGLREKIGELHSQLDGISPEAVYCAAGGATSILFAFSAWLHGQGITEIYYVPPLYFTFHYALKLFGTRARAVSGLHAFESGFTLNLPEKKAVLLLTDPIWFTGLPVPGDVIRCVQSWQKRTGSLVFVDGSFQYMRWDFGTKEHTAQLSTDNTFRLITPTKLLGIHGFRFAYVLLPEKDISRFSAIYANIYGSAATANCIFADVAIDALAQRKITNNLVRLASSRHQQLRGAGIISSPFQPSCGYFTFERFAAELPPEHLMSGEFFDQPRFPGYSRLNLLSPSFPLLERIGC